MKTLLITFIISVVLVCPCRAASGEESEELSADSDVYISTFPLRIINPEEGEQLDVLSSFVLGSADPEGKLTINGTSVPIHQGGGFITMIDYSTGPFTIEAELKLSTMTVYAVREVFVLHPSTTSQAKPLVIEYVKPGLDMELRGGDIVEVTCKGSPGAKGYFTISKVKGKFPLKEIEGPVGGVYKGAYIIQPDDKLHEARIKVVLKKGKKVTRYCRGRVTRIKEDVPQVLEVKSSHTVLRAGKAISWDEQAGYILPVPEGTRFEMIGKIGNEYKVRLSKTRDGWISEGNVKLLPAGALPPECYIHSVRVLPEGRNAVIEIDMAQKLPFEVKSSVEGRWIDVSFFGAVSNTDWINYSSSTVFIGQLQWFQDDSLTYRLRINLKPGSWWGYNACYEEDVFKLELRRPPQLKKNSPVLKDITVVIDAGHSPDEGAVGPTGTLEKDINMAIALKLEEKLIAQKAKVVMTRREGEEVGLFDRAAIACKSKADIFVSVHNNGLPEGDDPFERNGYGVYYYHPHSFFLAREIHLAYGKVFKKHNIPLRDDGLHYGNLFVARITRMPAVLVESAYMIIPGEEALLKTAEFQSYCAEAILEGIKKAVSDYRKFQKNP
jgi:N-acetylmuramoyl-L-alanine amidase